MTVFTAQAASVLLRDVDAHLVDGLRRREASAFAELVDRHQESMLRVARCYVGSRATAEDVVQETWLAVLRGVDRFDGRSTLKTWMYRILTNRAKTTGQRERRTLLAPYMASPLDSWQQTTEDCVIAAEGVSLVSAAINELPRLQRRVITLRDVDCRSAREACDILGLSEANQRVLLHRARAKVRLRLATSL